MELLYKNIKVGLIEDNIHWIERMENVIQEMRDIECILTANNIAEFEKERSKIEELDILFLDIDLAGEESIPFIPELKKKFPKIEIVMFTIFEDEERLLSSFCMGAVGYVIKSDSMYDFKNQINAYRKGGAFLSPVMARKLVSYFNPKKAEIRPRIDLNEKEIQILKLLAEGWSYKMVANRMSMSIDLLRYYVKKIYKLIHVHSKTEAVNYYHKYINPNSSLE